MPPRGRGRGRARGRGGRGRGAADTPADTPSTQQPTEPAAGDDTPGTTSQPITIPDDARSSTVTPAPVPVPASHPTRAASRPSATPGPSSSTRGGGMFKPKIVRRGSDERIRIAEELEKRNQERYAREGKFSSQTPRRSRARGRGRGALRGASSRYSTALGPLSSGMTVGDGGASYGGYGASSGMDSNRINADMLYTHGGDYAGSEDTKSKSKAKKAPMPLGIRRVEHKEEEVTLTTAAEIEAQERGADQSADDGSSDGLFVDEERTQKNTGKMPAKDDEVWEHALPKSRVRIKTEDAEMVDLDRIPAGDFNAHGKKEKDGAKTTDKTMDLEDLAEQEELEFLLETLGLGGKEAEDGESPLDGHMFLFRFPDTLPSLSIVPSQTNSGVKAEPVDDEEDALFISQKAPAASIDLTGDADVKEEEGAQPTNAENEKAFVPPEGGFVGKLIVRKSGKTELSWGGKRLRVTPCVETSHLTMAVLLEEAEDPRNKGHVTASAYGMGKIECTLGAGPGLANFDF
ncbi:RNA polymerase III RPC4-domain-containing protein [Echria macrotheca]|uniref:RNA polymerase III RPC4-domain-containing protein n=1 Tax=Echria macrotheca TaxID=438768 RepID=A0AAJ0FAX4_9PEZI|nr:RNA polymerase III RPC4-domain-containing protein [Echria macrotheca]